MADVALKLELAWTFGGGFYSLDDQAAGQGTVGVVWQDGMRYRVGVCMPGGDCDFEYETHPVRACRRLAAWVAELWECADIGAPAELGEE